MKIYVVAYQEINELKVRVFANKALRDEMYNAYLSDGSKLCLAYEVDVERTAEIMSTALLKLSYHYSKVVEEIKQRNKAEMKYAI